MPLNRRSYKKDERDDKREDTREPDRGREDSREPERDRDRDTRSDSRDHDRDSRDEGRGESRSRSRGRDKDDDSKFVNISLLFEGKTGNSFTVFLKRDQIDALKDLREDDMLGVSPTKDETRLSLWARIKK